MSSLLSDVLLPGLVVGTVMTDAVELRCLFLALNTTVCSPVLFRMSAGLQVFVMLSPFGFPAVFQITSYSTICARFGLVGGVCREKITTFVNMVKRCKENKNIVLSRLRMTRLLIHVFYISRRHLLLGH